jgi:Rad3-related DNA helicase
MLENPHVINNEQINISIVKRGINSSNFNFNYQNKNNMEMINDLGSTLESVAGTVPDGILVFFPSYRIMETTRDEWCKSGIFDKIHKRKPVFMEPKNSLEY